MRAHQPSLNVTHMRLKALYAFFSRSGHLPPCLNLNRATMAVLDGLFLRLKPDEP